MDVNDDVATSIEITAHAYERADERLSLTKKSFGRLAAKAMVFGVKHADTKGRLSKYVNSIWFREKKANNIRIYGENIFLFVGNTLITVYQLPNELRKFIKFSKTH